MENHKLSHQNEMQHANSLHKTHSSNPHLGGHDKHAGHSVEGFWKRFIISTLKTIPVLKMMQNLFWATGNNVIAMPLAAGVLYNYGLVLSPAVGAGLMSLSTIIVAINAQLLKRKIT